MLSTKISDEQRKPTRILGMAKHNTQHKANTIAMRLSLEAAREAIEAMADIPIAIERDIGRVRGGIRGVGVLSTAVGLSRVARLCWKDCRWI